MAAALSLFDTWLARKDLRLSGREVAKMLFKIPLCCAFFWVLVRGTQVRAVRTITGGPFFSENLKKRVTQDSVKDLTRVCVSLFPEVQQCCVQTEHETLPPSVLPTISILRLELSEETTKARGLTRRTRKPCPETAVSRFCCF